MKKILLAICLAVMTLWVAPAYGWYGYCDIIGPNGKAKQQPGISMTSESLIPYIDQIIKNGICVEFSAEAHRYGSFDKQYLTIKRAGEK